MKKSSWTALGATLFFVVAGLWGLGMSALNKGNSRGDVYFALGTVLLGMVVGCFIKGQARD